MFECQVALQYSFWRNYFFIIQKVVRSHHLELRQNKVLTSYCFPAREPSRSIDRFNSMNCHACFSGLQRMGENLYSQ